MYNTTMIYFVLFLLEIALQCQESNASIKVCDSTLDFYKPFSKNCWKYDYDHLNVTGIAKTWGFSTEEYTITLEDGYKITVFRTSKNITKKNPVILGHGAFTSAICFTISGNNSLAYVLANQGYDVWLINFRGTTPSRKHAFLKTKQQYWSGISFEEMATYDLNSTLDLVYTTTKQKSIYIGHSTGTIVSFIYCINQPEICQTKLVGTIAFSPITVLKNERWLARLFFFKVPFYTFKIFFNTVFSGELPVKLFNPVFKLASRSPVLQILGSTIVVADLFHTLSAYDSKYWPISFKKFSDNAGIRMFTHFYQIFTSGKFRKFDHGKKKNLEIYNSTEPPEYNLKEILVPVVLFTGEGDYIATTQTSDLIYSSLKSTSRCGYTLIKNKYSHFDFIVERRNQEVLMTPLLNKMAELEQGKCTA